MNSDFLSTVRICDVLPAGAGPWTSKLKLPAGCYRIAVAGKSNLSAANTTVGIAPFVDDAMTTAGTAFAFESNNAQVNAMAFPSGAGGASGRVCPAVGQTPVPMGDPVLVVANGLQITVTKGGSTSGEALALDIIIAQVRTSKPIGDLVPTVLA